MYTAWIKIDETLPWIEINKDYATKKEAKKAAKKVLNNAKIRIAKVSRKEKVRVVATTKASHKK